MKIFWESEQNVYSLVEFVRQQLKHFVGVTLNQMQVCKQLTLIYHLDAINGHFTVSNSSVSPKDGVNFIQ